MIAFSLFYQLNLTNSNFFIGAISETHRDLSGKMINESMFSSLLGGVLSNAKDWTGTRKKRNNKNCQKLEHEKENEVQEEEEDGEETEDEVETIHDSCSDADSSN